MSKKITIFVLAIMLFLPHSPRSSALDYRSPEPSIYTDDLTNISFTIPANWSQTDFTSDPKHLDAMFTLDTQPDNTAVSICFSSTDLWSELPNSEKVGITRAILSSSMLTKDEIAQICGYPASDLKNVIYNNVDYLEYSTVVNQSVMVYTKQLIYLHDAYLFIYQFSSTDASAYNSTYFLDFESLMSSIDYPISKASSSTGSDASTITTSDTTNVSRLSNDRNIWATLFISILAGLILTLSIFSLPITIYRYVIRKRPVERKKAKAIVIVYGLVAFFVMSMIKNSLGDTRMSGTAIFIWSFINYRMLIYGLDKTAAIVSDNIQEHSTDEAAK